MEEKNQENNIKNNQENNIKNNQEKKSKIKNENNKIINIIWQTIFWAIIIILVSIIVRVLVFKKCDILDYRGYLIQSSSMEPTLNINDAIITKKIKNEDELKEGDIIAFSENNMVVVHRIIKIQTEDGIKYYQTQGDNNNTPDGGLKSKKQIVGKMNYKKSNVGEIIIFIKKYIKIIILIIAVLLIFLVIDFKKTENK